MKEGKLIFLFLISTSVMLHLNRRDGSFSNHIVMDTFHISYDSSTRLFLAASPIRVKGSQYILLDVLS